MRISLDLRGEAAAVEAEAEAEAEKGMTEISEKFKEPGSNVYVAVKESGF